MESRERARGEPIGEAALAAGLGVDSDHLMWWAANKNELRYDQLPVACSVSVGLCHSRHELCEKLSSVEHSLDPVDSTVELGRLRPATIRRIDLSGRVTSSGACSGPPNVSLTEQSPHDQTRPVLDLD
jgi:hypothetical protein